MSDKTYVPTGEDPVVSQIGTTLEALASTIAARREAGEESYTYRLLAGSPDAVLKKVMEEAGEVALAAKDVESCCSAVLPNAAAAAEASSPTGGDARDASSLARSAAVDHLRYEAADVVYHLLVVLERYGIDLDEFAAELNNRMTDAERPEGAVRLHDHYVRRGK